MKIITLVGKSNSGKTMTLKTLIFQVLRNGGELNYKKPKSIKDYSFLSKGNANKLYEEFLAIINSLLIGNITDLTAKFDYKGKKVLITTAGDEIEFVKNNSLGFS